MRFIHAVCVCVCMLADMGFLEADSNIFILKVPITNVLCIT